MLAHGNASAAGIAYTVTDCTRYGDGAAIGTLAYELAAENASQPAASDSITFACGSAPVTILIPATITIGHDLTIFGGDSHVTLSGNDAVRVLSVGAAAQVTIVHLTIAHGHSSATNTGEGGAILNAGALSIDDCSFVSNTAAGGNADGAALSNEGGTVTITDSTFANNGAHGFYAVGGAVYTHGGSVTVSATTFVGNVAQADGYAFGGGLGNQGGVVSVTNSTFNDNVAQGPGPTTAGVSFGGGLNNLDGTLTLLNDTIAGNSAQGAQGGGNLYFNNGSVTLTNTILVNSLNTTNCGGAFLNDGGYNLIDQGQDRCNLSASRHDLLNVVDVGLGPLVDNGGATYTMSLAPNSPAVGAANATVCPPTDQRGVSRLGTTCDIGAYQVVFETTTTIQGTPAPAAYGQNVTLTASVAAGPGLASPTGTVTFLDHSAALGSAALDSSGQASITTVALAPGDHHITATYGGSSRFDSSNSAPFSQIIYELLGVASPSLATDITGATVSGEHIELAVPAGAVSSTVTIMGNPPDTTPPAPSGSSFVGPILLLTAADGGGNRVTLFEQPATLSLSYDPTAFSATDTYRLAIASYDAGNGSWAILTSALDTTQHTVSASFTSLGLYALVETLSVPPTTVATLSPQPNADGWINHAASVTLAATGGTGGVATTYYSIDDPTCKPDAATSCTAYTAPFTIATEGAHTIYYFSVSRSAAAETQHSVAARLDVQAPVSHLSIGTPQAGSGAIYVTSATQLTLAASDDSGSGIKEIMYCVFRPGGTCAYAAATSPFTIGGPDGSYEIDYYAVDKAANAESAHHQLLILDTTPPSSILTPATGAVTRPTDFHIAATDSGAGVRSVSYRVYAQGATTPAFVSLNGASVSFTFGDQPDGNYIIEYFATDLLGNAESVQMRQMTISSPAPTPTTVPVPISTATTIATATPTTEPTATGGPTPTLGAAAGGSPDNHSRPAPAASTPPAFSGALLGGIALALLLLAATAVVLTRRRSGM